MPIFVSDYSWKDSESKVFLTVPLKGMKLHKTDIVLTEEYLKVSFPPYIFECFFYQFVSDQSSSCVWNDGVLQITLAKVDEQDWPQLMIDNVEDKAVQQSIRSRALEQYSEKMVAADKLKRETKRANEKLTLQEMMRIEDEERQRIETVKQDERDAAMRELEQFRLVKEKQVSDARAAFKREIAAICDVEQQQQQQQQLAVRNDHDDNHNFHQKNESASNQIFDELQQQQQQQLKQAKAQTNKVSIESVIGVRQTGRIGVTFTERVFPTPERESQKVLEEQWLEKQKDRRQLLESDDGDLSQHEKDPVWLRDKGNSLFKSGNYHAAVNAYSHAIALQSKLHSLYSNRAACHLKLANYFKAAEDASTALELLQPPVESNRRSRARAHSRRSAALAGLRAFKEALVELEAAAKLEPELPDLDCDLVRLRRLADGDDDDDQDDDDDDNHLESVE